VRAPVMFFWLWGPGARCRAALGWGGVAARTTRNLPRAIGGLAVPRNRPNLFSPPGAPRLHGCSLLSFYGQTDPDPAELWRFTVFATNFAIAGLLGF
jgi:hypothetical protein